ncbi:uncharacterized protein LOC142001312 isoform X2 [Carettochelys insculpta]|uniref:uncharacterized protein LOC142001312 isoform X2 n=1 Tax=Carettochelys insculpta TaxID=44489 RepID=UPI003EC09ED9
MAGGERRLAPGREAESTTSAVTVATTSSSVTTSTAIASTTNMSANGTEQKNLTCYSFHCSGERCYEEKQHANSTVMCPPQSQCELYRHNYTSYNAQCSSTCASANSSERCVTNSTTSAGKCILECCNSSQCLQLNATAYGDVRPRTTPAPTTTTSKPPAKNGKVCTAFSCEGDGCFKGQKPAAQCTVGYDFCEMKKTGTSYTAGCSKACQTASPVCTRATTTTCYQECCQAAAQTSCLKLDGNVHFNGAGQVALAPLLKLLVCGVGLAVHYSLCAFLQS